MALGADMELENVVKVEAGPVKKVYTEEGGCYEAKAVILAVGVKHRTLGLDGEADLIGKGISFCAVCDGAFYAGQDVAMVGGGNSALQEALLLSEVCKNVTIVQNLPFFTGEQRLVDALLEKKNVSVRFSTLVAGYESENGQLTGLHLRREDTGAEERIGVDGVFLAVGLIPENQAFSALADLDERGYFDASEECTTATDGIFVAGDCRRKNIRQVVTASADGATAAMAACKYCG
jgi:thioredoxin reductase (NADPH)